MIESNSIAIYVDFNTVSITAVTEVVKFNVNNLCFRPTWNTFCGHAGGVNRLNKNGQSDRNNYQEDFHLWERCFHRC